MRKITENVVINIQHRICQKFKTMVNVTLCHSEATITTYGNKVELKQD